MAAPPLSDSSPDNTIAASGSTPRKFDQSVTEFEKGFDNRADVELVHVVVPPLEQQFTYLLPPEFSGELVVGCQLSVSFGRRTAQAFVVGMERVPAEKAKSFPFQLKQIPVQELPVGSFRPSQLPLLRWAANYYGETLANVLDLAVPRLTELRTQLQIRLLPESASLPAPRGKRERELLEAIRAQTELGAQCSDDQIARANGALAVLKRLATKGYISLAREELFESALSNAEAPAWAKRAVDLNDAQQGAVHAINDAISQSRFEVSLLFGVTGSGKTEVYIEAAQHALSLGKSVIVLVPEISLTPQLIDRFQARLGSNLAVLHSALPARKRWSNWQALLRGRAHVALGARSAVFAPVDNVGLIVVDEEHDGSYKQSEGFRYHGRDVAIALAQRHHCPVVLGSATPALETYAKATQGKYKMLRLSQRHASGSALNIETVDLNKTKPWDMASKHVSGKLYHALSEALAKGEQGFVLYNRRGFARYMHCEACEESVRCENCSVTMTVHRALNSLVCHYCGLSLPIPQYCGACEGEHLLVERGGGTEQIFEELKTLFPEAVIERLDRDTAGDHESYRRLLERLRSGEINIVVGTQMLAKGHDLPGVTVVGIADSDVGLHLPDFRAAERVFNLLTQAAGRAGRGSKPGTVLLQTRSPNHASLVMTLKRDYEAFAEIELKNRASLRYPPHARLMRVVASSQDKALSHQLLMGMKKVLDDAAATSELKDVTILGPAPAPLERLKTLWRHHLLVKSQSPATLNRILQLLLPFKKSDERIRVSIDIDPQEML